MTNDEPSECSLLLLPDGCLLARNVTPGMSELLAALHPEDPDLAQRMMLSEPPDPEQITHFNE